MSNSLPKVLTAFLVIGVVASSVFGMFMMPAAAAITNVSTTVGEDANGTYVEITNNKSSSITVTGVGVHADGESNFTTNTVSVDIAAGATERIYLGSVDDSSLIGAGLDNVPTDGAVQIETSAGSTQSTTYDVTPSAGITASADPAAVGQEVTFTANAEDAVDNNVTAIEWDLDSDGQYDDATGSEAIKAFDVATDHTVAVQVTDVDGNTETDQLTLTVESAGGSVVVSDDTYSPVELGALAGGAIVFIIILDVVLDLGILRYLMDD